MMLRYAGAKVDKMQLAREMPRSKYPNKGYIGNPWDRSNVTIFPPALMGLVQKYAGNAINMTGMSFDAIRYQVGLRQHPVVAWLTLHGCRGRHWL
ncbi:MAG: C39 family peptidase [Schleiferilactobacillus harbinensis]|uniref:C39 family peptidase n=1 Tax=Schleiferilactobacillus harbinensis TaxID=304207 RepID=UPI0039E782FB